MHCRCNHWVSQSFPLWRSVASVGGSVVFPAVICDPFSQKGMLSRGGRCQLQAKKAGTITVSSTWLSDFNRPQLLTLLRYKLNSNMKLSCILWTVLNCTNISQSDKIDLRPCLLQHVFTSEVVNALTGWDWEQTHGCVIHSCYFVTACVKSAPMEIYGCFAFEASLNLRANMIDLFSRNLFVRGS